MDKPLPSPPAARRGPLLFLAASTMLCLTGCQHRDPIDMTSDLVHQIEGGEVAKQRPPPPGQYGPYPKIGLTPTTVPDFPSPALRQTITANLIASRNLTQRIAAENGTLTPEIPPPPGQTQAAPSPAGDTAKKATPPTPTGTAVNATTVPEGGMGAILDAADSPPPPSAAPTKTRSKAGATPASGKAEEPELALPAFQSEGAVAATDVTQPLPEVPNAPPPTPSISGFAIPLTPVSRDIVRPNYDLSAKDGVIVKFLSGSDQLAPKQEGTLAKLALSGKSGPLFLHCSGETVSMDAASQTEAVQLGLLRGQTLFNALTRLGVPTQAIHITSSAFGPAARVSTSG